MTRSPNAIPLRPDHGALTRRAAALVVQLGVVEALATATSSYPLDVIKKHYPHSTDLRLHQRAASEPASLTGADWASVFAINAVPNYVQSLGPAAAMPALLRSAGAQYRIDRGVNGIAVVTLLSDKTAAVFVGELTEIPVRALSFGDTVLLPRSLKSISLLSRETFDHSIPNIEMNVGLALADNIGLAADLAMFDANPATTVRPVGLRAGIAVTAGESANADTSAAMIEDVRLLATTLALISGNSAITLITSPSQAWRLKMLPNLPFQVLMSSSITAGEVIAVANAALAVAFDPIPHFEMVKDGSLHLDTVPLAIGVAGSPNTVAARTVDLFSSDCLALKTSLGVGWVLRNPGGLAWIQNVVW